MCVCVCVCVCVCAQPSQVTLASIKCQRYSCARADGGSHLVRGRSARARAALVDATVRVGMCAHSTCIAVCMHEQVNTRRASLRSGAHKHHCNTILTLDPIFAPWHATGLLVAMKQVSRSHLWRRRQTVLCWQRLRIFFALMKTARISSSPTRSRSRPSTGFATVCGCVHALL